VTEDLKHLEQIPVEPTSNWLAFLRDGYKQNSVADTEVAALETRILRDFPHFTAVLNGTGLIGRVPENEGFGGDVKPFSGGGFLF